MTTRRSFIGLISTLPLIVHPLADSLSRSRNSWSEFTDHLAEALACLENNEYLVLSKKGTSFYVQFAVYDHSALRAEAVSNGYLAGENRLSLVDCAKLLGLGWNRPTHLPAADGPAKDPHGSPNYFLDFEAPVSYGSVAALAARTLQYVFGASDPRTLEYKAFSREGSSIRFPHLRLARVK